MIGSRFLDAIARVMKLSGEVVNDANAVRDD